MSFILDALKKSESDRQRQGGPALFEVKVAPPRNRLPLWAVAIALLLAVNLVIVAWMMLRHPAAHAENAAAAPAPAGFAQGVATVPAVAGAAVPVPAPAALASAAAPSVAAPVPSPAPLPAAAATPAATLPANSAPAAGSDEPSAEDLAPATEPAPGLAGNRVRRDTADGVPLYQELSAAPGTKLPTLRLDLHVYAAKPQDRFVMINMHKLREGDSLPEGVRLESVTPEGAVMSFNGSRFLLPRE